MTLYNGDTFTHEGLTFRFEVERDDHMRAPWEEDEGHGPVSKWTTRDKRPGEMIISEDGHHRRFYNFAAAVAIAKRDGWDAAPYGGTRGERAARAAMADFKRLRDWCDDRWEWVYVKVTALDLPGEPWTTLGGIESDAGDYFSEVAEQLADELIAQVAAEVERAVA